MEEYKHEQEITDALKVIKKAIEDESDLNRLDDDILLLTKVIKNDGTIENISNKSINNNIIKKEEILKILDSKIEKILDKHLENWLDSKMPKLIDKYFSKK